MLKLVKYLKSSIGPILLVVALLVVQAMCDLALPEYTSRIVNVGIQQGGIENAVPQVIRQSEMEHLFLFMSESDQARVLEHYEELERSALSENEYTSLVKKYPVLADEPLYRLKKVDAQTVEELDGLLSRPMLIAAGLASDSEEMAAIREGMMANIPASADMSIFDLLAQMPAEQRAQFLEQVSGMMNQLPESMISQGAVLYVKAEYKAIGMNTDSIQTNYVLLSGLKMLSLALASMLATILVGFLASRVAASLGRELRGRIFRKVVSFSNAVFDRFSTASLITRSTNDIQQIQMLFVMLLRIVFYAPILGIGGVLKVLNTNTSMAWIIAVAVMAILTLVLVLFAVAMPKFKIMQKLVDKLNLVTREILTGLPVIRAFSTQKHEEKRFDDANQDLTRTSLFVNRVMTFMMPVMMLIMNGISILIVWTGSHGVDTGAMQVGDLMAFIQYTMQIIMSFLMISMISIMLPRASVSAERIQEVLETDPMIREPEQAQSFDQSRKGVLEFRNVSFHYPNAEGDVIHHVTFTARPGQTTAIIGSTGSGKSTLVNLIPRFYDVTEGEILLDGVDIRQVSQHDLRARIGYVPQKGVLFSGTIASNLKYGRPDMADGEMEQAARIAQAEDFITAKPDGYEAEIAQGGTNVSGGQKQRLSIARAIAVNPEVYIFDDSFSALDYKTDVTLRKALQQVTAESTVIIVAQRISTILHAEQIIVLDEGNVAGIGTHQELMESCEVYQQIALSQLSKEELAQ